MNEEEIELRVRRPVGAVLSVRVPRELATAADEFARERSMTLSDVVRLAVEDYLAFPPPRIRWGGLYGSTGDSALVVNSLGFVLGEGNMGGAQTETLSHPLLANSTP